MNKAEIGLRLKGEILASLVIRWERWIKIRMCVLTGKTMILCTLYICII